MGESVQKNQQETGRKFLFASNVTNGELGDFTWLTQVLEQ